MALSLTEEFNSDIQSRNTALIPVIKIGDIFISTNDMPPCKPLLLNIPSLKESQDV